MPINNLVKTPGQWLMGEGPQSDIVLSSRVRLARNLARHHFVGRVSDTEKREIADEVRDALSTTSSGKDLLYCDLEPMTSLERRFLVERHLISREQERGGGARGVAVNKDETVAIMVNEEDHLRMQGIMSGMQLHETFSAIDKLDDELSTVLDYAYDDKLGYLTACPTNVGTGMRVSVMLHLPGLVMTRHIEKAFRAVHDHRLTVRGLYGEGTEAQGELYQISNQITIGRSETEIIEDLRSMMDGVIEYERKSRERLMEVDAAKVEDRVWRAYATLQHARVISSEEAMSHLSSVRLGVCLGILPKIDMHTINQVFVYTQPAHLQRVEGRELEAEARDVARAGYIREKLKGEGKVN
ncbi:MAG: protein arginine kinase [Planctomycetes bacterium]|nr:protein arginine kinase [Planctomycetota bacterium]